MINRNGRIEINLLVRGFSLVELMIVLVIVGILSAIAYPSYTNYIERSRRADGQAALTQTQIILERCYAQNFAYNAACPALPTFPQNSAEGFYTIALSNLSATTYTLTATPQGAQAHDTTCSSISINQAQVKTASDSGGTAQSTCWGSR